MPKQLSVFAQVALTLPSLSREAALGALSAHLRHPSKDELSLLYAEAYAAAFGF